MSISSLGLLVCFVLGFFIVNCLAILFFGSLALCSETHILLEHELLALIGFGPFGYRLLAFFIYMLLSLLDFRFLGLYRGLLGHLDCELLGLVDLDFWISLILGSMVLDCPWPIAI